MVNQQWFLKNNIGKFLVENDTLVSFTSEEEAKKAPVDEDVNNKMFIVVRNLKTTTTKTVNYNEDFIIL